VTCSAGTYIRTLCVDIGKKLGYPEHMSHIGRIEANSFTAKETVTFEEMYEERQANRLSKLLLHLIRGLKHMDSIQVDDQQKMKVLHGQKLPRPERPLNTNPFSILSNQQLLAIYKIHPDNDQVIKPVRVFNHLKEM